MHLPILLSRRLLRRLLVGYHIAATTLGFRRRRDINITTGSSFLKLLQGKWFECDPSDIAQYHDRGFKLSVSTLERPLEGALPASLNVVRDSPNPKGESVGVNSTETGHPGGVQPNRKPREAIVANAKAPLREQVREVMRFFHYSLRTERTYWQWIHRFLLHFRDQSQPRCKGWRHPRSMGAAEVREFLGYLAAERRVAAATQNQALNALVFLYGDVLHQPLGELGDWMRAERRQRLPVVLTRSEVRAVLETVDPECRLPLQILYGTGLRVIEMLRLRVKDLHLPQRFLIVRSGKGDKDRRTMIPEVLVEPLKSHLQQLKVQHEDDVRRGFAGVWLPNALDRKYPNAVNQDVATTQIYTHVMKKPGMGIRSPLDWGEGAEPHGR